MSTTPKKFDNFLLHFRKHDKKGTMQATGGLTVLVVQHHGGYGVWLAKCTDHDHFCRRIGRMIVEGRSMKKEPDLITTDKSDLLGFVLKNAMSYRDKRKPEFFTKLIESLQ